MPLREKLLLACVIFLLVPFICVGILTGIKCVKAIDEGDMGQAGLLALFSVLFTGVPVGGFALVLSLRARKRRRDERQAALPAEPWLWRDDWSAGVVKAAARGTMVFTWAFALLWNLISIPLLIFLPEEIFTKGNTAALFGLLFPVVGAGLLVWAVRSTLKWFRFGSSVFKMSAIPGVIGGTLEGSIELSVPCHPTAGFRLTLTSVRRTTSGSGESRSTSETILWQDDRMVAALAPQAPGIPTTIPVYFTIPFDCPPTDSADVSNSVVWRLDVNAEVPGVDFDAQFEVPVYRTARSSHDVTAVLPPDARAALSTTPPEAVVVLPAASGGTEFYFPPARNAGVAATLTGFWLLWTGVVVVLLLADAPWIFPIVFGLIDLLLLVGVAQQWTGTSRIIIDAGDVTVRTAIAGIGRIRSLPCRNVTVVKPRISMQSGNTPYYSLIITTNAGREIPAGGSLRSKREAEWLAGEVLRLIRRWQ